MLKNVLQNQPKVDVVQLQKSGDVPLRKVKVRQKARNSRIRLLAVGSLTWLDS
ncbi:hypothetical protein DsansV1_C44g0240231 [Dioscorea sansibarensis]